MGDKGSQCQHPPLAEIFDHGTGDVICSSCGLVKLERSALMPSPPVEAPFSPEPSFVKSISEVPYRMALSEACQQLGLPTANLLVDECLDAFKKYCAALNYEKKNFPTKLPILAYAFQRVLTENDIYRLPHVHASLFDIRPRRLLQAENEVCQVLSLSPLYIAPSLLIETLCRWLHLKPVIGLLCRDLCEHEETRHFGKNPEWIIYSVLNAVSNRLRLMRPECDQVISMSEVRSLLQVGGKVRKIDIDMEFVNAQLCRRPLV